MVDREHCSGCGLCALVCHEHCIDLLGGIPRFRTGVCSTCTQCIAVCPQQSLSWDGVSPRSKNSALLPSAAQLNELFMQRRSARHFRAGRIDRSLLAEVVGSAVYAPTENTGLRAIVIDDETMIRELDRTLVRVARRIYNLVYRWKVVGVLARLVGAEHAYRRQEPKLREALRRGTGWRTLPAAIVFIVGRKGIPLSDASAQYALANVVYCAQAHGLGSCLCGNGPLFFDRERSIRKRLALSRRENILAALVLGYPAITYANVAQGKAMPLQWNGNTQPS